MQIKVSNKDEIIELNLSIPLVVNKLVVQKQF